ncbi:hypothetical protein MKX01_032104 [Papaver californicum]|nr:hypothetical protein MKX01_032104 [Papaver californicum]
MAPKKEKALPPSSKPAKSGGGKQKKKKWSKVYQKEKVNNMVLFDQARVYFVVLLQIFYSIHLNFLHFLFNSYALQIFCFCFWILVVLKDAELPQVLEGPIDRLPLLWLLLIQVMLIAEYLTLIGCRCCGLVLLGCQNNPKHNIRCSTG